MLDSFAAFMNSNLKENQAGKDKGAIKSNLICVFSILLFAMGFPAAFQKHVGLTVDEFAESFSNFMNSGSPDDPPPEGFFTEKPLSELVDFWSLKTNPSAMTQ